VFALSTSWNIKRHSQGEELVREIHHLKFEALELNVEVPEEMVLEIESLCQAGEIKVLSIHNFCPRIDFLPPGRSLLDAYLLTSENEIERRQAIEYTKRTIVTAARLGAKAVVIHWGRVEIDGGSRPLYRLFREGKKGTEKFQKIKAEVIRKREERAKSYIKIGIQSLEELDSFSRKQGIKIGLENRYFYEEMPSLEELKILWGYFSNRNIFYWHDTGHAQMMENLGLARHEEFLQVGHHRMIGIHFHDIIGDSDHRAPGSGEIPFEMFRPYLCPETIKVLELDSKVSKREVVKGLQFLQKILP